jgi:hypothetical protein
MDANRSASSFATASGSLFLNTILLRCGACEISDVPATSGASWAEEAIVSGAIVSPVVMTVANKLVIQTDRDRPLG